MIMSWTVIMSLTGPRPVSPQPVEDGLPQTSAERISIINHHGHVIKPSSSSTASAALLQTFTHCGLQMIFISPVEVTETSPTPPTLPNTSYHGQWTLTHPVPRWLTDEGAKTPPATGRSRCRRARNGSWRCGRTGQPAPAPALPACPECAHGMGTPAHPHLTTAPRWCRDRSPWGRSGTGWCGLSGCRGTSPPGTLLRSKQGVISNTTRSPQHPTPPHSTPLFFSSNTVWRSEGWSVAMTVYLAKLTWVIQGMSKQLLVGLTK